MLETEREEGYLVGDSGYACFLLTPVVNPVSSAEQAYNSAHIAARNCIERTNGLLKRRFPALKYGMRLKLSNVLPVIVATAVLHNIAMLMKEEDPPEDEQLDTYLNDRRRQGMRVDYDPVEFVAPVLQGHTGAAGMRRAVIDGHFT